MKKEIYKKKKPSKDNFQRIDDFELKKNFNLNEFSENDDDSNAILNEEKCEKHLLNKKRNSSISINEYNNGFDSIFDLNNHKNSIKSPINNSKINPLNYQKLKKKNISENSYLDSNPKMNQENSKIQKIKNEINGLKNNKPILDEIALKKMFDDYDFVMDSFDKKSEKSTQKKDQIINLAKKTLFDKNSNEIRSKFKDIQYEKINYDLLTKETDDYKKAFLNQNLYKIKSNTFTSKKLSNIKLLDEPTSSSNQKKLKTQNSFNKECELNNNFSGIRKEVQKDKNNIKSNTNYCSNKVYDPNSFYKNNNKNFLINENQTNLNNSRENMRINKIPLPNYDNKINKNKNLFSNINNKNSDSGSNCIRDFLMKNKIKQESPFYSSVKSTENKYAFKDENFKNKNSNLKNSNYLIEENEDTNIKIIKKKEYFQKEKEFVLLFVI